MVTACIIGTTHTHTTHASFSEGVFCCIMVLFAARPDEAIFPTIFRAHFRLSNAVVTRREDDDA